VTQNASSLTLSHGGAYVYATNPATSTVVQFTIGAGGPLSLTSSVQNTTTMVTPYALAVDQTGDYAYVADRGASMVAQFTIDGTGALAAQSIATVPAGTNPTSIVTSLAY
jgi:6-phosphogluconolactonase (cycloisomerase 2 family)